MAKGCAVQTSCTSRTVRKVQKGFGQGRAVLWVCVGKEKLYALTLGGTGGLNLFEHKGKAALEQSSQRRPPPCGVTSQRPALPVCAGSWWVPRSDDTGGLCGCPGPSHS